MAGVKGRSGGPRPGAGRKAQPKPPPVIGAVGEVQPLEFLEQIMRNPEIEDSLRVRAAIAAAQYRHTKVADGGKKDRKQEAAQKVAGRFSAAAPPKLVAAGGSRV